MSPSLNSPFTDYIRALNEGGETDARLFSAAYQALRTALVSELKKKGLWEAPPSYLGIYGRASWAERIGGGEETLDELLPDCYQFIFIRRLRSLRGQLRAKGNIDGLVFLGIRNFLHDKQRKHDPLGYRVFELVRSAIDGLRQAERLFLLAGGTRLGNESVLGFTPTSDLAAGEIDLEPLIVPVWGDAVLPGLLTAQGRDIDAVLEVLRARLLSLREQGIQGFRLRQVLEPFKNDVRQRWGTLFKEMQGPTAYEDSDQETPRLVPMIGPETGFEEREAFYELFVAVAQAIETLEEDPNSKRYLRNLWGFLRLHAQNGADTLPSKRQLAKQLAIPRDRLTGLLGILAGLVRRQRSANLSG